MNDLIRHRWQQIDTLFGQALEQRRSFLLEICGTDTDLQAHVEKLLQLHDEAGQILGESTDAFAAPLIPGLLDETSLIRQKQRASVWPNVEVSPSLHVDGVRIFVQNTGVGSARIQAANISYNGKTLKNWSELIQTLLSESNDPSIYQSLINGRVFPPASSQEAIFSVTEDTARTANQELMRVLRTEITAGNLDVEVCYCSVYDECWTSSLQDVVKRAQGEVVPTRDDRNIRNCNEFEGSGI